MKGLAIIAGCVLAAPAVAQQAPAAKIPIRQVAPPDAKSGERLKSVRSLVQFSDGHVLVQDAASQRLLFFDPTLGSFKVTADTTHHTRALGYPNVWGTPQLFSYLGDSAVLADMTSMTFTLIGPDGALGRAMANGREQDFHSLNQPFSGAPAFDAVGRFVYRAWSGASGIRTPGDVRAFDTLAVLRREVDAHQIETIATIALPLRDRPYEVFKDDTGKVVALQYSNLVPPAPDEWAVITDGSIAVVRASDYHIDWVYADGTKASTPKMPYEWRRLTDADKQAKIDSAKRAIDSLNASPRTSQYLWYSCTPGPRNEPAQVAGPRCLAERADGTAKRDSVVTTPVFSPVSEMLDYVPPVRGFSVKSDRDNHLWILPSVTPGATGGGLLYDVVNKQGEVFERVQLPAGRTIAGFGPNGVVYLLAGDRLSGFTLEKTHVMRSGSAQ